MFLLLRVPAGVGAERGREEERRAMSVGIECVYAPGRWCSKQSFPLV